MVSTGSPLCFGDREFYPAINEYFNQCILDLPLFKEMPYRTLLLSKLLSHSLFSFKHYLFLFKKKPACTDQLFMPGVLSTLLVLSHFFLILLL